MALALPRALRAGQALAAEGAVALLAAAQRVLLAEPALAVDYLALVDLRTFTSVQRGYAGPALLLAAAKAGGTRLIDNVPVALAAEPATAGRSARRRRRPAR